MTEPTTAPVSVGIVGLGSRGLSVLERIVTLARLAGLAPGQVRVEIIDPACTGAGVHDLSQPDYLLLNTTCSQASMFPDSCTVGADVGMTGPSLYGWATERDLRLAADGYTVGETGRPIRPTDFLPRRLLGEYLRWFFGQLRAQAAGHIRLNMHAATALDLSSAPDGSLLASLSDGTCVQVNHLFLTTGYTPNSAGPHSPGAGQLTEPYPLPERLASLAAGQQVAIAGFGLSAMDVMSCLTVGRGGRFVSRAGQLRYVPSGREPALLMYSRSGVPCRARPKVVEFGPKYQPLAFTAAGIDALRAVRGGPLDFDADVLPLVLTEMRAAYRRCQARRSGPAAEAALDQALGRASPAGPGPVGQGPAGQGHAGRLAALTAVLDVMDARLGRFDAAATLDGSIGMDLTDAAAYERWLSAYVLADLAEGLLGFAGSPVKAALDVLRELRDTFRYAIDFGGLTPGSLEEFTRRTIPAVNRAVVGPQYERHLELLALLEAGIVRAPFGPAPEVSRNSGASRWTIRATGLRAGYSAEVEWIVAAQVPLPAVATSASPLLASLHRKGWIRPYRPDSSLVHGIDIGRDQHPVDARGVPDERIWVLGPLCEGATFYNNLVPSPNMRSRPVLDAHRCVAAMLAGSQRVPGRVSDTEVRQPIG
ncbi:MAG: FAD/NAD(P)-binding protein [Streptosporangiaceae bacterium]